MCKPREDLAVSMIIGEAPVVRMEDLGSEYFRLGLDAPAQAARTRPGHFFMLGAPAAGLAHDPLLNRPISALDVKPGPDGAPAEILFLVKKVGRGTRLMGRLRPGDRLLCHGPLGRPFPDPPAGSRLVLVGGGVGIAPLFCCAREWGRTAEVTLFYGGRTAGELPLAGAFGETGIRATRLVTEDGSLGGAGLVTAPLADFLNQNAADLIYTCGPNPMMEAVFRIAAAKDIPVWVSMENRMGCGLGACLGCAIPVLTEEGTAMLRVCREGPVFDGRSIAWTALQ
jgi:dihydroorotate dehydrogenase electron transfer subunit